MDWISIEEKLPESGESVLVSRWESHDIAFYDYKTKTWWRDNGERQFLGITHWMTLPELPRL